MMKKIYVLFLLFFSCWMWGQVGVTPQQKVDNRFQLIINNYTHKIRTDDEICSAYTNFLVNDGTSENTILHVRAAGRGGTYVEYPLPETKVLISTDIIGFRIEIYAKDATDKGFGTTSCKKGGTVATGYSNLSTNVCNSNRFSENLYNGQVRLNHVDFNYKLLPLHTLTAEKFNGLPNTYLPGGTKVNFYAKEGFAANLYNYQYRLEGETEWKDVPPGFNGSDKLSISAEDLLGSDYINHLGKKIYLRVASCREGLEYASYSEPVPLTITSSAPKIISSKIEDLKCSYSEDGKATLTFDRKIFENEYVGGTLTKKEANNTWTGYKNFPEGELTPILRSSNQFIIDELGPGEYKIDFRGRVKDSDGNLHQMYSDGTEFTYEFNLTPPTLVEFSLSSKTDVFCYGGSDGIINIKASGGQGQFQYSIDKGLTWINFNHGAEASIEQLSKGIYKILVRDSNACFAQEQGENKVIQVEITQPEAPLKVEQTDLKVPTGYGLSNGYIVVDISGGTPKVDDTYSWEWHKDSPTGPLLSQVESYFNTAPKSYSLKLNNIGAGKYYLTVKDKNYAGASSNLSACGIINQEFVVTEPELLVAEINIAKSISCNAGNLYSHQEDTNNNGIPDDAEDGKLAVEVTGGVADYSYQWQKKVNGGFQDIAGETSNHLINLTEGHYKVVVMDKNSNQAEAEFNLQFPPELKLALFANSIKCNSQNEGEVSATITGGTEPYFYQWSTGDSTPIVTGLDAGNYYLLARDAKGCSVDGNVEIVQPASLLITEVSTTVPSCSGVADGAISIKASGGEAPYKITWSNGMTGESIAGLSAGTYTVKFEDKNGCFITENFTLTSPDPFLVDLGKDITLCSGDSKIIDALVSDPLAKYVWTDEAGQVISTNSAITLTDAGTYTVTVTNANGCSGSDQIIVKNSTEVLQPNFLVTTYAFTDKVIEVINTSYVKPEKINWEIPVGAEVISETDELLQIKFRTPGAYTVGLHASQGECEKLIEKEIIVEENDFSVEEPSVNESNIKSFVISPNPNSGSYQVIVELKKEASIRVRTLDMQSREVSKPANQTKDLKFTVPFNVTLPGAAYLVILETGNEVMVKKMIIK